MKKRLFILTTVMMLSLTGLTACGKEETTADVPETETVAETTEVAEVDTEVVKTEDTEEVTETVEDTEVILTEETEETETPAETPAYTVKDMTATKYAKSTVNLRKGPSSDYEKVGGLSTNQQVTVTGQADTGWYRIDYNGKEAFVSDKYLVNDKVNVAANNKTNNKTNNNTTNNASTPASAETTNTANTPAPEQNAVQQPQESAPVSQPEQSAPAPQPSTPEPTPAPSAPAPEPQPDTNTGSVIDASNMTDEELDKALADVGIIIDRTQTTGGSENIGVGGDWGEFTHD